MKNKLVVVITLFFVLNINSYAGFIEQWDYRYGGASGEFAKKLYETLDHGFLICGNSPSFISYEKTETTRGDYDFWIVKTDSAGNVLWDGTYGSDHADYFTCALLLPDSGFLLGGYSFSNAGAEKSQNNHDLSGGSSEFWIIKIDKLGNKIWDKSYGGNQIDALKSMVSTPNGSFLLAGITESNLNGDMTHNLYGQTDYWVVKIDSIGNILWDNNYGGSDDDYLRSVVLTTDYGFILGGVSISPAGPSKNQNSINNSFDYWIVKIDSNGILLWDKTIGGDGPDFFNTINLLPNDYLLIGGNSNSGIGYDKSQANHGISGYDYWFIKTDSLGIKIWDKVFGGNGSEDDVDNVTAYNSGFLITGTSYSNISGDKSEDNILNPEQGWVLAIDSLGSKTWDMTLNTVSHLETCYGFETYDGCFIFMSNVSDSGGCVSQNRNSQQDYWAVKFCIDNNLPAANYSASSTTFCLNTCLDFMNLSTNAAAYQWYFPGGLPSSSTQSDPQGICYDSSGTFDVTLVAINANGSDTLTLPHYLTVYPQVPFTPITQVGDTLFSVSGFSSYQWYNDTLMIPGANNYFYTAQHSGNYSVIVTDSNGCFATAYMSNVIASNNDLNTKGSINILSSKNGIIIENKASALNSRILVASSIGEIIYENSILLKEGKNEINLNLQLSAGIYIVAVQNGEKVFYKKIFFN